MPYPRWEVGTNALPTASSRRLLWRRCPGVRWRPAAPYYNQQPQQQPYNTLPPNTVPTASAASSRPSISLLVRWFNGTVTHKQSPLGFEPMPKVQLRRVRAVHWYSSAALRPTLQSILTPLQPQPISGGGLGQVTPLYQRPRTNTSTCPQGHPFAFSYVGSNWNCDRCHRQSPPGNSNQCRRCNYDVCAQCIGAMAGTTPSAAAAVPQPPPAKPPQPTAAVSSQPSAASAVCPQGHH